MLGNHTKSNPEWMDRLRGGDREVFDQVFSVYWDRVFSLCAGHTDTEDDAKDLTQDIFLSLWERRETLVIEDDVEKYLSRAARYRVSNYIRSKVSLRQKQLALETPTTASTPEQVWLHRESDMIFEHWIEQLPDPGRTYFLRNRVEGLSYKEIASGYGISAKTVEYHISAVLRVLRLRIKSFL